MPTIEKNKLRSLIESGLVDREDGTIFDTRTNLLWQQVSPDKEFTWQEAIKYCKKLRLAGYNDWRLPTIEELKTLINKKYKPAIDPIFECEPQWYWSSSPNVYYPFCAWFVDFGDGLMNLDRKTHSYCVRAVRG